MADKVLIVCILDDSTSMKLDQEGLRIEMLKKALRRVSEIYTIANKKGITSVQFLNKPTGYQQFKPKHVALLDDPKKVAWHGFTRIGKMLEKKILNRLVFDETGNEPREMAKPLIIIVLTDGDVSPLLPLRYS